MSVVRISKRPNKTTGISGGAPKPPDSPRQDRHQYGGTTDPIFVGNFQLLVKEAPLPLSGKTKFSFYPPSKPIAAAVAPCLFIPKQKQSPPIKYLNSLSGALIGEMGTCCGKGSLLNLSPSRGDTLPQLTLPHPQRPMENASMFLSVPMAFSASACKEI